MVFLALQLLCRSVQRFRDQTSVGYLTLGETSRSHSCLRVEKLRSFCCNADWCRVPSHHALSSQEVGDDFFIHVVHQASGTLVVISSKYEELLTRVLINQWADLHPDNIRARDRKSKTSYSNRTLNFILGGPWNVGEAGKPLCRVFATPRFLFYTDIRHPHCRRRHHSYTTT